MGSDDAREFVLGARVTGRGNDMVSVLSGKWGWQYKGGYRVSLVSELRYNGGGLFMLGKGEPTS